MFDPGIGRWLTEDPTGFDAGDANLTRYCGNGPTNHVDPSGLITEPRSQLLLDVSIPRPPVPRPNPGTYDDPLVQFYLDELTQINEQLRSISLTFWAINLEGIRIREEIEERTDRISLLKGKIKNVEAGILSAQIIDDYPRVTELQEKLKQLEVSLNKENGVIARLQSHQNEIEAERTRLIHLSRELEGRHDAIIRALQRLHFEFPSELEVNVPAPNQSANR